MTAGARSEQQFDEDTRSRLLASDLCVNLAAEEAGRLLAIARLRHLQTGELILTQGREADAVYLPVTGQLQVERSAGNGQRQVLAFLQHGDYLGFSNGGRFLYSAHALTPCTVVQFPAPAFYSLAEQIPTLKDNVGRISNLVLAHVLDHLFAIGQKRAHARLAFLLWQLWLRLPAAEQANGRLTLPMRRADIGDYLGLTLETTSRAFTRLRTDGLIATSKDHSVELRDLEALRILADVR